MSVMGHQAILKPFVLLCFLSADFTVSLGDEHPPHVSRTFLRENARDAVFSSSYHYVTESPRRHTVRFVHCVVNRAEEPLRDVEVAVALPRNTERQTVHDIHYEPRPAKVTQDPWKQKTAHFHRASLDPGKLFKVVVSVEVTLRKLEWLITERDVGSADEIPRRIAFNYLRDDAYVRLGESGMREAAERVRTSQGGFLGQLRAIHDFVIDELRYERDERWDRADQVLSRGSGSCSEYSFLMIALCRLNGIPARYAGGSCFPQAMEPEIYGSTHPGTSLLATGTPRLEPSTNMDHVFHRWVEVYLPRLGWFPVDPTRNDFASRDGDYYRHFGRLPWFYLTMSHGSGNRPTNLLDGDYRSSTKWQGHESQARGSVRVQRYAIWEDELLARPASQNARLVVSAADGVASPAAPTAAPGS